MFGRSSHRECTRGHYHGSGRYPATKARRYVSMATCLETVTSGASGNVNNQGFGFSFCYKRLNLVIDDSDFVILGLDLLIYGSDTAML